MNWEDFFAGVVFMGVLWWGVWSKFSFLGFIPPAVPPPGEFPNARMPSPETLHRRDQVLMSFVTRHDEEITRLQKQCAYLEQQLNKGKKK